MSTKDPAEPSDKIMALTNKVEGTKIVPLMAIIDQIGSKLGATPVESDLASAIRVAIGAEAARDALLTGTLEQRTRSRITLNEDGNIQKIMDTIDMLEHAVVCLREALEGMKQ